MNNSEADRRSHRFASGIGIKKTHTNGTKTLLHKNPSLMDADCLDGPIITHVHRGAAPEVYAAAR